uniref:Uncharacterized protein n=1 Tax=Arundo donax TaxID=35708 RepID=A0A0A9APS0_ARUDO
MIRSSPSCSRETLESWLEDKLFLKGKIVFRHKEVG